MNGLIGPFVKVDFLSRKFSFFGIVLLFPLLSGCAAAMVTGAVVGTAATASKVAVKTTVGAGKLVYGGSKAVVKGTAGILTGDEPVDDTPQ